MAQATEASPYTVGPDAADATPAYVLPGSSEYAVPGPEGAEHDGWWDATGYAPTLRISPIDTPDANRLRLLPVYETRENGDGPPDEFNRRYRGEQTDRDRAAVYQDADGQEALLPEMIVTAPRPEPSKTGEPRPTNRLNPHRYVFTRPFGTNLPKVGAQRMNGTHFSMADHRRDYGIGGMAPNVKLRPSTYRVEPQPWDAGMVIDPADTSPLPVEHVQAQNLMPSAPIGQRTWRLT